MAGSALVTSSAWLSIISLAQLLGGLVARTVYAGIFGTSREMDVFLLMMGIVSWFTGVVVVATNKALVPTFSEVRVQRGEQDAWRMASTVINGLGLVSLAIIGVGWALAHHIALLVGGGLEPEARSLAAGLLRLAIPILLTNLFSGILTAFLFCYDDFVFPRALRLVGIAITVAAVVTLSDYIHIYSMAVGMLADGIFTCAVLGFRIRSKGLSYDPLCLDLKNRDVFQFVRVTLPLMGAALFSRAQDLVDRFFASFLTAGSISFLNYASMLMTMPNTLLTSGIQVIFPHYSRLAARGDLAGLRRDVTRGLALALFLTLPAFVGLLCLGRPALVALFQHGRFDAESTEGVWAALPLYFGLLVVGVPSAFLSYALYALQETRVILWIGLWDFTANVILDYVFMHWLGYRGIALATSAVLMVDAGLLLFFIQRRIGVLDFRSMLGSVLRAVVATAGMAVVVLLVQLWLLILPSDRVEVVSLAKLMAQAAVGIAVYAMLSLALSSQEAWYLVRWVSEEVAKLRVACSRVLP